MLKADVVQLLKKQSHARSANYMYPHKKRIEELFWDIVSVRRYLYQQMLMRVGPCIISLRIFILKKIKKDTTVRILLFAKMQFCGSFLKGNLLVDLSPYTSY